MTWTEDLPEWTETGDEPSAAKKAEGWLPNEKPPAGWFNWLFNRIYASIVELRGTLEGTAGKVLISSGAGEPPTWQDTAPPSSHTHGDITNDGKIGSTAGLVIVTGTAGVLTAKTAGTSDQFLRGDGSWAEPASGGLTDENKVQIRMFGKVI